MIQEISPTNFDINDTQPRQQTITSFNRPPRTRPQLPAEIVRLPVLPSANRQGRAWSVISSMLTSGVLIGASYLVSRTNQSSLVYLVPMIAGASIFMLLAVVQLVYDTVRRWRESMKYAAALKLTTLRLIQLYTDQQYIRFTIDPELIASLTVERAAECDREQAELLTRLLPSTLIERLLHRTSTPAQLGLRSFSERLRGSENTAASLLDIAGRDADAGLRTMPRSQLWERRPTDADFLYLRIGTGDQPATVRIEDSTGTERPAQIEELIKCFATVHNVPLTLSLPEAGALGLAGPREPIIQLAHALLWQITIHHAPSEVRIAAIYQANRRTSWSWLYWLPHTFALSGERRRMLAVTEPQIDQLLISMLDELSRRREQPDEHARLPQIVLLLDGDDRLQQRTAMKELLRQGKLYGINVIVLAEHWERLPGECGAMMQIDHANSASYAYAGAEWSRPFTPVLADTTQSERLSRGLRPFVLAEMGGNREIPRNVRLLDLLRSYANGEFNPVPLWKRPLPDAWHPDVPIGRTGGGEPIYLDLREHHDGPHGIIAGKTGAGKSELLQSIITALAATHAPDRAQFLLIDFKGGASLRPFEKLPHTVGLVTDLQDGHLAERAITAMRSEIRRRKDLLNQADVQNIGSYRALADQLEPLANLLVIIDEFDTMVKEQPGFVNELITVVKQGRSLGVHLLVASQEPSSAVKDEIKGQLQYWMALRLGTVQDSREMLQRPDAFYLPSAIPGRAYLRVGTEIKLFQGARVSAPFQGFGDDDQEDVIVIDDMTGEAQQQQAPQEVSVTLDGRQHTDLDFISEQINRAGSAYRRRQIWCPPLPARLTLSQKVSPKLQVLPPELVQNINGQGWWHIQPRKRLCLPIGIVDIPQESRQDVVEIDLNAGHVLVYGAPGSGKTTLLRTLLMSLGMTHSPSDVWCYIIDAGGQGLNAFQNMPHIGGVVHVRQVDQVRRVIWMVQRAIEEREKIQSDAEHQEQSGTRHSARQLPAILLIIDKFALFREEYEAVGLIEDLIALSGQGRSYDIHLVITTDRPGDVPHRLQGLFDTRLLLRLTDESDALMLSGRRAVAQIPLDRPGRGYRLSVDQGWLEFQTALPYIGTIDEDRSADAVNNLLDGEVSEKARRWTNAISEIWRQTPESRQVSPPPVRLLPEHVSFKQIWQQMTISHADVIPTLTDGLDVLVGLEAQTLGLARFTLKETSSTILVVGGYQSGKTTALRTMLSSLAQHYLPDQIQFVLVDPRRNSFRDLPMSPHQRILATTESDLAELVQNLERVLEDETEQRRWVICIDDYEVGQNQFSTQFQKPFSGQKTFIVVLEKLMNLGRERGFSLIIGANTTIPTQLLGQLNASRNGLILQPHNYPSATDLLGVRLPIPLSGSQGYPGRGLMVKGNLQQWVQVASNAE